MSELLPYKIGKRAAKEFKRIRKTDQKLYRKMNEAIEFIRKNPFSGNAKTGDLKGYFCIDVSHIGTNYELCYTLEEDDTGDMILIVLMGPRENFYEQLKRYLGKT
ncbi:Txe/YoeB family toxin of Txe-Axe toxin-antitoxin module [Virgibacillus natechei]|uniref:Txe/YoeB family toxin of Txe-Axe toxin-antitoxin module n=1 Tax=Virgibacillus natechei TaxID=1216297 RepID=A0ABS4IIC1_9BACI|nr:type II toxin-antitoxin system RelE/ParE family toxin [Virgibacillus natechei]MBP1970325.1 Txe/YoeB family toxin of Txe-Axe toxin-antitoxin module [Virgibacillus natechei]UZD13152.1 type II toxin-antitoxin system RelE/ParE family toxin [Virgibacillus natechei]